MRFLLVEDSHQLANVVQQRLKLSGHVVDCVDSLAGAMAYAASAEYDLILLDIMLPDGDGRTFLQTHRQSSQHTPVIVLTARSEVSDRVGVLDLGADDYLIKPFDFSELEARCRAVLRRRSGGSSQALSIGDLIFDGLAGTLQVGDNVITLRNRELRLLEILIAAPNRLFSKAKLIDRLFSYDEEPSANAIEVYIARLRKHLQGSKVEIVTVRGIGYKLLLS